MFLIIIHESLVIYPHLCKDIFIIIANNHYIISSLFVMMGIIKIIRSDLRQHDSAKTNFKCVFSLILRKILN